MTHQIPAQSSPPEDGLTVNQIVTNYLAARADQVAAGLSSAESLTTARFYLHAFLVDFGDQPVAQCRRGDVKRFITKHPEYKSPHTKHIAAGYVVTCFRWAEEDGLIPHCPYVRPRDLPGCEPRAPIWRAEVNQILRTARTIGLGKGHRKTATLFRLAVWFLWETGCRTCEMYKLDWEQWDAARGCFELNTKTTQKTGRKRLLVLPARAWRLINFMFRWRFGPVAGAEAHGAGTDGAVPAVTFVAHRVRPAAGPVFPNSVGKRWTRHTFGQRFRAIARKAGVRKGVSAYCLRHGFVCESLEGGAGERQLADYLGHSSTRYVSYYGSGVKSRIDYLRDAGERRQQK